MDKRKILCCLAYEIIDDSKDIKDANHGNVDIDLRTEIQKIRQEHAQKQKHDYSHVFRKKSYWDIMRISCIIIGIEFAYAAETAFVSPTLLEIGIEHKHMTMVWSLAPMIGFILSPIMGSLSDRCRLNWGRRRPLILLLCIILFIGLMLVGWGTDIGLLLGDTPKNITSLRQTNILIGQNITFNILKYTSEPTATLHFYKWTALVTVFGSILLDFSSDNCQTPARTFLLDMCLAEDHTKGLSTFTVMAGLGGFVGYSLGAIDWADTMFGQFMGGNVKTVFSIVIITMIVTCIITLTSFREIPLPLMEQDSLLRAISYTEIQQAKYKNNNTILTLKENFFIIDTMKPQTQRRLTEIPRTKPIEMAPIGPSHISFGKYLKSICCMPKSMKILCFTNLLSWMANTAYSLYFTDFVGESVFHGDPTAVSGSDEYELYHSGLRFGCWGLAIYALSCAIYSVAIGILIKFFGTKFVYIGGLLSFGIGMLLLSIWPTKLGVLVFSIPAGVIYATIFTIPFLLIAKYHACGSFNNCDENVPLKKQARGLGTDVAIVTSMMFVAQIIVSLCIGPVISCIGSTTAVIYSACALSLCAAVVATQVLYVD